MGDPGREPGREPSRSAGPEAGGFGPCRAPEAVSRRMLARWLPEAQVGQSEGT